MRADLRSAWRGLRATPGFAVTAIVSLAIGIGANTAIFSVVDALLLRPLPYADADRLVILWNRSPGLDIAEDWFSTAQYFDIRNGHPGFEDLALAIGANENLTDGSGAPERVGVLRVSSNLLPMIGARAVHGRLFEPVEDHQGATPVALLSDVFWRRRYGGDPAIVGRTIQLNGEPTEIVGVLPPAFALPHEVLPTLGVAETAEIVTPLPLAPTAADQRGHEDYNIIGKLNRGVDLRAAQAEMDGITRRLRDDHPDVYPPNGGLTFSIVPLRDQVVGGVRRSVLILLGAVGCVLLIACANVANLLLARAIARQKEVAIRVALGAGRRRLVRQMLVESLLLCGLGAVGGLLLARLGLAGIRSLQPANLPRLADIGINGDVWCFTLALSAAAGLLFGLAPMLSTRRLDVFAILKEAGRGAAGRGVWGRGGRARRLLVIAELALSVVLLVGAGLLIRSLAMLLRVSPGFTADHVLTLEVTMTGPKYGDAATVGQAYRELWHRLEAVPGVGAAGGVSSLPLSGYFAWGPITVEGRARPEGENFLNADQRIVAGRYFEAMGIPLLRGRLFDEHDTPDQPRVVIVDDFMARELWPGQDPIGRRVRTGGQDSTSPWRTVVGVVGRVKQYSLDSDGRIAMYFPHTQSPSRALYLTIRTDADPVPLVPAVTRAVQAIDPDLPLYHVRTMAAWVTASLARQRFAMWLLAIFAGAAAVLAAVGVYGVMGYLVSQGAREIGIRLALGASEGGILRLVLGHGLLLAAIGIGAGVLGAMLLAGVMRTLVFGVGARDLPTFMAVAVVLIVVALAAAYVPARRAARIDPLVSLRAD